MSQQDQHQEEHDHGKPEQGEIEKPMITTTATTESKKQ
jgi:hypothetical protein